MDSMAEDVLAKLVEVGTEADVLRDRAHGLLVDAVREAVAAGLSQRQIAASLGRSQPEVSRLSRLGRGEFRGDSPLGRRVRGNRATIRRMVRNAGAANPRVFGSVARQEDDETSDIDIMVDIPDSFSLVDLTRLQLQLSDLLDVDVDLVPSRGLRPPTSTQALAEAVPV